MITCGNGILAVNGERSEVLAEAVVVLQFVYQRLKEEGGEQYANETLAFLGRLAVSGEFTEGVLVK